MMKYIRTEYKIIKAKENKWHELVDKNGKYISEFEIINQADTIEELCDEFVQVDEKIPSIKPIAIQYDEDLEEVKRQFLDKKHKPKFNIYGAIWTDKGLIYVAKMNEKGELQLL